MPEAGAHATFTPASFTIRGDVTCREGWRDVTGLRARKAAGGAPAHADQHS